MKHFELATQEDRVNNSLKTITRKQNLSKEEKPKRTDISSAE